MAPARTGGAVSPSWCRVRCRPERRRASCWCSPSCSSWRRPASRRSAASWGWSWRWAGSPPHRLRPARRARRRPGRILAPGFDREAPDYCLLAAPEDRNALGAALNIGKRICRTLPSLAGMVDTDAAERLLASALFDLAKVLQHRQDVRTLLIELRRQRHRGLPADSPAARKLMAQRDRLKQALSDLDAEVARRLGELEATAVASENFMREREIHQVTSRVDQTLASLAPTPFRARRTPASSWRTRSLPSWPRTGS
ncbi:hypothetical protein ACFQ1L_26715 [Phytohabitans flavus]|uniref:hypothetical protein n=1 Tax=Phytohabitans flavus TaxID=1076124 RepID=UPI00362AFBE1